MGESKLKKILQLLADLSNCIINLSTTLEKYLPNAEERTRTERELMSSGIVIFDNIIPAPFLEDEFIEKLASPEEVKIEERVEEIKIGREVEVVKIEEPREERKYEEKPSLEILEKITADVLRDLGFRVEERAKLRGKGHDIEVDVWGVKIAGDLRFYVYASCKNWNRKVDKSVIDEEFGRTLQLHQTPHLKIFIAKELTDPARETALADGFIVIELKEKANSKNANDIYKIISGRLKEIFIGIAPPELQKIAKETKEISERLKGSVNLGSVNLRGKSLNIQYIKFAL